METPYYNMLRTVFVPQQNKFVINIPDELISKRLELLIPPLDFMPTLNTEEVISNKKYYN